MSFLNYAIYTNTLLNFISHERDSRISLSNSDDIITNLKYISKIDKFEKINIYNMNAQRNCLLTTVTRTIFRDNRQNTLLFIKHTIEQSFKLLHLLNNSDKTSETELAIRLSIDIRNAISGIRNIKITYSNDIMYCAKLDTILDNIDVNIIESQNINNNLFPEIKREKNILYFFNDSDCYNNNNKLRIMDYSSSDDDEILPKHTSKSQKFSSSRNNYPSSCRKYSPTPSCKSNSPITSCKSNSPTPSCKSTMSSPSTRSRINSSPRSRINSSPNTSVKSSPNTSVKSSPITTNSFKKSTKNRQKLIK